MSNAPAAVKPAARRPLSLLAATALVVANMIGVGIFTTTGFQAQGVGGALPALAGWLLGGALALSGAAVYSELGAMMPRAGGEYVYLRAAFRPWVGFLSGWVSLWVGFSAPIAAAAYAFGRYLQPLVPWLPVKAAGLGLIAAATLAHMRSVLFGARLQTAFAALKVGLLVVFIAAGLASGRGDLAHLTQGVGLAGIATGGFAASLVYLMYSYAGWNAAAYVAGELRDPGRTVPRALLWGTGIVTLLYVALNIVFFYAAPAAELATAGGHGAPVIEVGDYAARKLLGRGAGHLISSLIALALVSAVSAMVMAGPRVYLAMAEDGLFFSSLARLSPGGAPTRSVLLQGGLAVAFLLAVPFDTLLEYIGFTLSLFASLTVVAAFVLRKTRPDAPRPYATLAWPLTPLFFLAINLWMMIFLVILRPVAALAGAATLAIGGLLYLGWRRSSRRPARDAAADPTDPKD